jgi:AraC family transcriptional regulator
MLGKERQFETVDRFLFRDANLKNLCRQVCREIILRDRADRLRIEMLAIELAEVLFRDYSIAPERTKGVPTGGLTRNNAKRVLEYAEANLERELTLRELAGTAELSTHHFVRMFKKTLGVTPYQYLLERRVERAKDLLRCKRASLAEVALSSGFGSQSHFTSTFHRAVGATPAEFQRLIGKAI